jgi:hypothetical protein
MDLFKFNVDVDPTVLKDAEPIHYYTSATWIERYADPGEVKIVAPLSSGLREFLPAGTFISHIDTPEVMMIESHEVAVEDGQDPVLTISGRSMESYLENRVVGMDLTRSDAEVAPYELAENVTWDQIVAMINSHIVTTVDPNDRLIDVSAAHICTGTGTSEVREIKPGTLHKAVLDLLDIDDLGIKTMRKSPFTWPGGSSADTIFLIHQGVNLTDKVIFSSKMGDVKSATYLFSDKQRKNCVQVVGRYLWLVVDTPGANKFARRMGTIDATDLDGNLSAVPLGTDRDFKMARLAVRGRQYLRGQKSITISQNDIADTNRYNFRRDYNIGDLVTLDGDFDQIMTMRVTEFAEIEDENGQTGHPTLSIPGV